MSEPATKNIEFYLRDSKWNLCNKWAEYISVAWVWSILDSLITNSSLWISETNFYLFCRKFRHIFTLSVLGHKVDLTIMDSMLRTWEVSPWIVLREHHSLISNISSKSLRYTRAWIKTKVLLGKEGTFPLLTYLHRYSKECRDPHSFP